MQIDKNTCSMCGCCIAVCPFLALRLTCKTLVIDSTKCSHCGACEAICPAKAIKDARAC